MVRKKIAAKIKSSQKEVLFMKMNVIFPTDPLFPWPKKIPPIFEKPGKKNGPEKLAKILKELVDIIFSKKKKK